MPVTLGGSLRDYLELTKPRITLLVLITTAAGYYMGSAGAFDLVGLAHTLLGTALVAAGTGAMNQVLERDVDGRMRRTRNRPLPAGRLGLLPAAIFALALAVGGILYLGVAVNRLTALLAAATFLMYDLLYTPLKRVHPVSLLVGAVPGALPIAGGWAAASGQLDPGAWALFGVLFLWQLPHFLALSWLLRDDYRRAGLAMPSVEDSQGSRIRLQALAFTLALVPVSLLPALYGVTGTLYTIAAITLGLSFVVPAVAFSRRASSVAAGRMFRFSLLYLPLLLAVAALDKSI